MESTDAELVGRAQAGDTEAFGALVRRHGRLVFAAAFKVTGDEALAEDVAQDAFLRAWERIGQFDLRARFTTWIYRIAVNRALDSLDRRRSSTHSLDAEGPSLEGSPGLVDELHPQRLAEGGEIARRTHLALARLTPMERTGFVLRHVEGLSIAEIGDILGTRTNATKQAVFRAVRKLRLELRPLLRNQEDEAAVG